MFNLDKNTTIIRGFSGIIGGTMKYHVWTEGCQMNVADSRRVSAALEHLGYQPVHKAEDADLVVLNTCVVRQSAEDKALSHLHGLRKLKLHNPEMIINVMGCLVGVKGNQKLVERFPYVDVFSAPSDTTPLMEFLSRRLGYQSEQQATETRNTLLDDEILPPSQHGLVTTHLPVVLGCSHACTYCIIPYRRGVERSRPPEDILAEARAMVNGGVREITLLGQIVDRYGKDAPDYPTLAWLLTRLNDIEGLERIRFLTSHPNWMTDELLDAVALLPKAMPHIEVPIQAGDDEILANMHRGYSVDDYRRLIGRIRKRIPHVSIGTDIIIGFPGETEAQFQNTYNLLAELKLDVAHLARYSPREGTVSARRMPDDVPDEEKWRRFRVLEDLQEGIAAEIHALYMGQEVVVLFEGKVKKRWRGRTPNNELVFVETDQHLHGQTRKVTIAWTGPWSMIGSLS
jgi:tRNA-2-methylthio-N6-dimethylallyladenosine synthase